jgi:hypothetical protein
MRARLTLAAGTAALAVVGSVFAAAPASAQSVTFTLSAGSLSVAEPSTAADLVASGGNGIVNVAGGAVQGNLGATIVTDQRGSVAGWTSNITGSSAFTNGTTSIPVSQATVWVDPTTISHTGTVTAATTHIAQATGVALTNAAQALVTGTLAVGNNTATFTPTISVAVPTNATAGSYAGAVTQTVS